MRQIEKIKDECSKCGKILECELCRQGHGIGMERINVSGMLRCQIKHRSLREEKEQVK